MRLIIVILKTESSLKIWSRFQEKQRIEIRYMPKIKRFKRFKRVILKDFLTVGLGLKNNPK